MPEKLEIDDALAEVLSGALKLEGFFPEFKATHAKMIFLRSGLYLYAAGAHVLDEGEQGRDLFILYQGQAEVVRKEGSSSKRLNLLKEGEVFGEIGMLRDGVRSATVVAVKESKIFRLVYQDIQYLLEHNKELGSHLDRLVRQRSS